MKIILSTPKTSFFDEWYITNDLLSLVIKKVLEQLPSLSPEKIVGYKLVSKRFKVLISHVRNQLIIEAFQKHYTLPNCLIQCPEEERLKKISTIVDARDKNGRTCLQESVSWAIENNSISKVADLLYIGLNPNKPSLFGTTPLTSALCHLREEKLEKKEIIENVIVLLLEAGANPNGSESRSSLLTALEQIPWTDDFKDFQLKIIKILCDKGADPRKKYLTNLDSNPISPLERAKQHYPAAYDILKKY